MPPKIHTYHCLCTSLLLATTHDLSTLPSRKSSDKAIILPLPPSPTNPNSQPFTNQTNQTSEGHGYTLILGLNAATKATIIRIGGDTPGFEKRYLWRCGRCGLVGGYELVVGNVSLDDGEVGGEGKGVKILYLLPGGVMSTEEMVEGKTVDVDG